jgi:hypothetical protein
MRRPPRRKSAKTADISNWLAAVAPRGAESLLWLVTSELRWEARPGAAALRVASPRGKVCGSAEISYAPSALSEKPRRAVNPACRCSIELKPEREPPAAVDSERTNRWAEIAPHWSGEDSLETVRMSRRSSGATHDRRHCATAIRWPATAGSRGRALASATTGRSNHHHGASAATARRRFAQRESAAAALQGRPFPRRARRQWDRCEVRGRGTDACLRRYHDAVPRQARNLTTANDGIGRCAAMTATGVMLIAAIFIPIGHSSTGQERGAVLFYFSPPKIARNQRLSALITARKRARSASRFKNFWR